MHSIKILYISAHLSASASGGKALSEANLEILKSCRNVDVCELSLGRMDTKYTNIPATSNRFETALANLKLYSGSLHKEALKTIIAEIAKEKPDILYLDSSLFGRLALTVQGLFKNIRIVSFFHNVEFDFKLQCYVGLKRLLYIPAIFSDWINERLTIKYSNTIITLHCVDSKRLKKLYGRDADFIHPVCIVNNTDNFTSSCLDDFNLPKNYILFVGSDFPPNIEAIKFLCDKVMPYLNCHLIIVGSKLENYRQQFLSKNVTIIGSVKDISPFYANAHLVVTPIFSGAGMKVKVAEALMNGKCIIGSSFSFIGYERAVESGVCIVAESASDYITLIKSIKPSESLSTLAKDVYLSEFSFPAGTRRMEHILNLAATA